MTVYEIKSLLDRIRLHDPYPSGDQSEDETELALFLIQRNLSGLVYMRNGSPYLVRVDETEEGRPCLTVPERVMVLP